MNKSELITKVADNNAITKIQARAIVEDVFTQISEAVKVTGKASFLGFGNFSTTERKARVGRNPQTGAPIEIAAKTVVKFKAQF
ncbi:HU family DNA-binding protein [Flavobacterium sp. GNP002]